MIPTPLSTPTIWTLAHAGSGTKSYQRRAQEIFDQVYVVDQKSDNPEQFRAIGWCRGRLCSVIFEVRHDSEGESYHLVTAWKATSREEQSYAENV